VKGLSEEIGQKLFQDRNTKDLEKIEGKTLSKQTSFQQELLREGSEERAYWTEKELESKLNDNRQLLENKLEPRNLSDRQ